MGHGAVGRGRKKRANSWSAGGEAGQLPSTTILVAVCLAVFACFELSRPPEVVAKIWQASSCLVCLRWLCSHLRLPLSNSTRGRENRGIPSHCNGHIMCLAIHRVCECISGRISRSAEQTCSGPNHEGERAGTAGWFYAWASLHTLYLVATPFLSGYPGRGLAPARGKAWYCGPGVATGELLDGGAEGQQSGRWNREIFEALCESGSTT